MKQFILLTVFLTLAIKSQCFAYITYQNSRIDRALYEGHEPKTVVIGEITSQEPVKKPADDAILMDCPQGPVSINFKVQHCLMGHKDLEGTTLNLYTLSFDWPTELVKLENGNTCILIIQDAFSITQEPLNNIITVVPYNENAYNNYPKIELALANNNGTRKFLEQQILAELKSEKDIKRQQALLEQVGPIAGENSENEILPFTKSTNAWVKRAALAALVFATQKQEYMKEMALDINAFFTKYSNDDDMIGGNLEYNNYSASWLYYRFVFFLDPGQRVWGSRWDDKEANINQTLVDKLKSTGLLSKKVQHKLKC